MGHNVASWEMIRSREEKLSFDDDQHAIMNNMVDARACYKPSGKVSVASWNAEVLERVVLGDYEHVPIDPADGIAFHEIPGDPTCVVTNLIFPFVPRTTETVYLYQYRLTLNLVYYFL